MTRPTDIDQEERAVGAAFRAALLPPPGTTDPDALDAAFLGSLRAAPSDPPPPPDLAPRLAGIARRARRRALLRRAAALLLAVLLLAGCAAAATRLWREVRFTDKSGAVSDEWTVCGDVWTLGGNWAESRGLRHGTMPLEWKAPVDTNVELRARIRLTAGDDPVHGVRVALTSGNRLQPGVEILLEPNRLGVSIGPGHDEWGRWALSGSPGSAVDWFDKPPRETEVPVRIVWHCGVISVFLGDERDPRVQTRKCQSYFDPDEFSEPAVLRIFATGIRLSDLAVRPSVPDPAPPPPVPADLAAGGPPSPAIPPQQSRLVDAVLFLTWLETGPGEDPVAAVPHLRDYSAFSPDPATRAFVAASTNLHASDAAVRVGIGSEAWWNDTWCLPVMQGETVAALCSIDLSPPDADGLSDVRVETAFAEKRGEIVDGDRISARFETRARLRSFDDESLVLGPIPAGSVSTNANARAWLVVAWNLWDHAEEEPHAEGAESDSRAVPAAPQPRDPADAVLFLKWFEADPGADPAAGLPHVGEGKVSEAPDPATRAFLVSGTNDLAGVVARDSSIIEADWGRPAFQKTVQQSWRAPACKTESLLWNVIVSNPGPDGDIVFCRVEATLSGNPDPAPDAECVQVGVKALAPLPRGDRLVLGPIPAGHVSTNANARAWLVVAWDHAAEEPHAAATPDSVIAPPTVLP